MEEEIFKRSKIVFEKLISYGFHLENDSYMYEQTILNETFQVKVQVTKDGSIKGKIYDLVSGDEYTNYRLEYQTGSFVTQVREEFENVLKDIQERCTISKYFITDQANRITNWIYENYQDHPQFLWEKSPGCAVFRNYNNEKWYGLITNINKNKIDEGDYEVEILNVKLDPLKINDLLKKPGYYPAYHQNKENWISIILNDTLLDEEIMNYIQESYQFIAKVKEWLVPANPKYYDVIHCFDDKDTMLWKQSNSIKVGDIVYLYVGAPYSAILYQCAVLEVDIPYHYNDQNLSMNQVMKIQLLNKYNDGQFPFSKLKEYGVTAIRGPRGIPDALSKDLNKLHI